MDKDTSNLFLLNNSAVHIVDSNILARHLQSKKVKVVAQHPGEKITESKARGISALAMLQCPISAYIDDAAILPPGDREQQNELSHC